MNSTNLQKAIVAIKAGDKQKGREIIARILKDNPDNEQAWLWLTQTDITNSQKIKSLQQVLRINPNNEMAKKGLILLQAQPHKDIMADKPVASNRKMILAFSVIGAILILCACLSLLSPQQATGPITTKPEIAPAICNETEFIARLKEVSSFVDIDKSSFSQRRIVFKQGYVESSESVAHKKLFTEAARTFKDLPCLDRITIDIPLNGKTYQANTSKDNLARLLGVDFAEMRGNPDKWTVFLQSVSQEKFDKFVEMFVVAF